MSIDEDRLSPEEKLLRLIQGDDVPKAPTPEEKLLAAVQQPAAQKSAASAEAPARQGGQKSEGEVEQKIAKEAKEEDPPKAAASRPASEVKKPEVAGNVQHPTPEKSKVTGPKPAVPAPKSPPAPNRRHARAASAMAGMADLVGSIGAGERIRPEAQKSEVRSQRSEPARSATRSVAGGVESRPSTSSGSPAGEKSAGPWPSVPPAAPKEERKPVAERGTRNAERGSGEGRGASNSHPPSLRYGAAGEKAQEGTKEIVEKPVAAGEGVSAVGGSASGGESPPVRRSLGEGGKSKVESAKEVKPPTPSVQAAAEVEQPKSKVESAGEAKVAPALARVETPEPAERKKLELASAAKAEAGKGVEGQKSKVASPKEEKEATVEDEDLPDIEEVEAAAGARKPAFLTHRDVLTDDDLDSEDIESDETGPGMIGTGPAILMSRKKHAVHLGIGTVSRGFAAAALFLIVFTGYEAWRGITADDLADKTGTDRNVGIGSGDSSEYPVPRLPEALKRAEERDILDRVTGPEIIEVLTPDSDWAKTTRESLQVLGISARLDEEEPGNKKMEAIVVNKKDNETYFVKVGDVISLGSQQAEVSEIRDDSLIVTDVLDRRNRVQIK